MIPPTVRPSSLSARGLCGWVPSIPVPASRTSSSLSSSFCSLRPPPTFRRTARVSRLPSPAVWTACASASSPPAPAATPVLPSSFDRLLNRLTSLFPLWVALGAVAAVLYPPSFTWFETAWIRPILCVIMGGMGLTLAVEDFAIVFSRPSVVLLGVLSQYGIMPACGFLLGRLLHLPPPLAVGLLLVSCCPGGAASNIVCLIGEADVSLSVVLTVFSTLTSVLAIPTLMKLLGGTIVDIQALPLLISTAQFVLLPLAVGLLLKRLLPGLVRRAVKFLPFISVAGVVVICGSIVARTAVASLSPPLVGAIFLLHAFGGLFGYSTAKLFRLPTKACRTISIEVCMQNSALAVALASLHFANPLVCVPGAISATMHSILGSLLAGFWRRSDEQKRRHEGEG